MRRMMYYEEKKGETMGKKYVAYVGTYTEGNEEKGLYIFDVDLENGTLILRDAIVEQNPAHLCISHNKQNLYVTSDLGVIAYRILPDGGLEELNRRWIGGIRGCYLSTDSADRHLFIAGFYDGRVTSMCLEADGRVGEIADAVFHKGVGKTVGRRNISPHVNCVTLTPDEKYLCAVDNGLDCVKVYDFDAVSGKINMVDIIHLPLEAAPRHMIFSEDGKFAYIISELLSEIEVYAYADLGDVPSFERIQSISSKGPEDLGASAGSEIMLSPDNRFLVCSNAGLNSASMYARNMESGLLTYLGCGRVGGQYPKTFAIFPDGEHLASLNYDFNEITFFHFIMEHSGFLECARPVSIQNPNSIALVEIEE